MNRPRLNVFTVALFYVGMFGLAVWIDSAERVFRFAPHGPSFWSGNLRDQCAAAAVAAAAVFLSFILMRLFPAMRRLGHFLADLIGPLSWTDAFVVAAFSALGEEFLFRGVLQHYLGVVPAALIFGTLHTGPGRRFIPWTLFAVMVGLVLGFLYERTGNLLAPVAAHFWINFINLRLLSRWSAQPEKSPARSPSKPQ